MASVGSQDLFDLGSSTGPPTAPDGKLSWDGLRQAIKKSHKSASYISQKSPHTFTFRNVQTATGVQSRLYFLGVPAGTRENTLLYSDIPEQAEGSRRLEWKPLLEGLHSSPTHGQFSKEEQLLRERKRLRAFGITAYDYDGLTGSFAFPVSSSLFTAKDLLAQDGSFVDQPDFPVEVKTTCGGCKMDPKLCPGNPDLVAFISNNDLCVANVPRVKDKRLTYAHNKGASRLQDNPMSAGVPSFVVQEEFDRYTGYWWQPLRPASSSDRAVYRILYEEVDEGDVDIHNIVSASSEGSSVDEYRYPKAGTANAKSSLKMVEFELDMYGAIVNVVEKSLSQPLDCLVPSMEYLLRAGWTPDGKYVYAIICDRAQRKLQILLIPLPCFVAHDNSDPMETTSLRTSPGVQVIYEDTSDVWLHIHDILHFLPCNQDDRVQFLWASQKSGYLHLYHVTSRLETSTTSGDSALDLIDRHLDSLKPNVIEEKQITIGEWEAEGKQIWVDTSRKLVYFIGYEATPLETHLYVVSYENPGSAVRLTQSGFTHAITMDKDCSMFVTVYSSITKPPSCQVFRIVHTNTTIETQCLGWLMESTCLPEYQPPELFSYPGSGGFTMHGMVYKPQGVPHGESQTTATGEITQKRPTVLFVYAGPQVQLVSNSYKGVRFLRLHTLASLGYAVVVIDSRGSCHRGLRFEGHIKDKLGQVEIDDQVEGLSWLAQQVDYIDINRVAIHGWSYGGYMSLLGLIQRPDIFKVAIAGAPVTTWHLYDTGYTERYMDIPQNNPAGYRNGSVLEYIDRFPTEENRLLIVHGLIDENVHFLHTSVLINALIKACKPYQLQVYPNERHGIRNPDSNEHYETMLLNFLQNHL